MSFLCVFSTEDMSFEFKKAFEKATELRSLTFSQQWTMSDDSIFQSEHPIFMGLFNLQPGKKLSIRQLQGTYGPFLIKTTHFDIYQENCWKKTCKDCFKASHKKRVHGMYFFLLTKIYLTPQLTFILFGAFRNRRLAKLNIGLNLVTKVKWIPSFGNRRSL